MEGVSSESSDDSGRVERVEGRSAGVSIGCSVDSNGSSTPILSDSSCDGWEMDHSSKGPDGADHDGRVGGRASTSCLSQLSSVLEPASDQEGGAVTEPTPNGFVNISASSSAVVQVGESRILARLGGSSAGFWVVSAVSVHALLHGSSIARTTKRMGTLGQGSYCEVWVPREQTSVPRVRFSFTPIGFSTRFLNYLITDKHLIF